MDAHSNTYVAGSPIGLFDTNGGGTFFFPTPPSTARACIDFWTKVAVPDLALSRFANALFEAQAADVTAAQDALLQERRVEWANANPQPKRGKEVEAWNQAYAEFHKNTEDSLSQLADDELLPGAAHHFDVSQLARVAQMVEYGPDPEIFPAESQALLETAVVLFRSTTTVQQAWERHKLWEIRHNLDHQDESLVTIAELKLVQAEVRAATRQVEAIRADSNGW